MGAKEYLAAGVFGFISLANIGLGSYAVLETTSKREGVRNAVYAKAKEITPGVIEQAEILSRREGMEDRIMILVSSALAAGFGLGAVAVSRKR